MSRWKELVRGTAAVLAAVALAGMGAAMPVSAKEPEVNTQSTAEVVWKTIDNKVPVFEYQKSNTIRMYIQNNEDSKMTDIVVEPYIADDSIDKWPFRKDNQDDEYKINELDPGKTNDGITFEFTERDDSNTGNHKIYFRCTYKLDGEKQKIDKGFWVKTTAKPEEKKEDKPLQVQITDTTKRKRI